MTGVQTCALPIFAVAPAGLFLFFPQITPIIFLFGLAAPAWVSAKLYSGFFKKLEAQIAENNAPEEGTEGAETEEAGDERIFKDELDESLLENTGSGQS